MSAMKAFIAISAATLLTVVATYLHQKRKKRQIVIPKNWQAVGRVSKLCIYPIKSGRRYEVQEAECTENGFREIVGEEKRLPLRDRQFVVYTPHDGEFRTARTYPKLVLVELVASSTSRISLKAPEMENLTIDVPDIDKAKQATISLHRKEKSCTYDCGDEASKWISRYILGKDSGLRLGYQNGQFKRDLNQVYGGYLKAFDKLSNETTGLYSDMANYLMVNQSSVDDLNERLEEGHVSVHYFRPNILIEGVDDPYVEDDWEVMKIGDIVFHHVMPCTRCVLTTIDPENGERDPKREPLTTLNKYRQLDDPVKRKLVNNSPVMGVFINPLDKGLVKVGDEVFIAKA